jgi:ribosomal protein L7/L12
MMDSLLTKEQNKILPIEIRKECEMLIEKGAKLHAVKLIKDNTHLGLRESKHIADCIHEEMIVRKAKDSILDHIINERDNRKIN